MGESFNVSLGGGFTFYMLHCELYGKPTARDRAEKIDLPIESGPWGRCQCGGGLSHVAPRAARVSSNPSATKSTTTDPLLAPG